MLRRTRPSRRTGPALLLATVLAALSQSACKVGPDYEPPTVDGSIITDEFGGVEDPAYLPDPTDITEWWTVFDDPILTSLIQRTEEGNKNLQIAMSRVSEARSRLGIAKGRWYPAIGINGGTALARDQFSGQETRTRSSLGVGLSWELDVFGRIAREVEAASAEYHATEEDQRDVRVSLFAEVARAYIGVRSLQMQLASAERNLESQSVVLELTRARQQTGISSGLDVARAEGIYGASEAAVPPLRIGLAREINTLGILIGKNPLALHEELAEPAPIPIPPETVTVGFPADMLRQRPDIRGAERRLAAQTARVGIATADLYPTFGIDGTFGWNSSLSGNLFDSQSRALSLGPTMRWALFNGGQIRNAIDVEDARVDQALLQYEQIILLALEEVETSLTTFTQQGLRVEALDRSVIASTEALRLATILYRDGLIDYDSVLDVQRTLIQQEIQAAAVRGDAATALVFLYRALGGGWDPDAVEEPEDVDEEPELHAAAGAEPDSGEASDEEVGSD